jgi:hypothetical protein
MEGNIIVVFYSKYSQRCTEFFELIRDYLDYRKICVDNPEIRSMILNETQKYSIRTVPCVLIFYSNGIMNKFENQKAFEWANNMIFSIKKSSTKTLLDLPNTIQQSEIKNIPRQEPIPVEPISVEPITEDNLMGMKRRIETSPLIQRNGNNMEENRMDGNRNEKKVQNKKSESIKNLAQQLQAEREKEDEVLNPNAISKIPQAVSE